MVSQHDYLSNTMVCEDEMPANDFMVNVRSIDTCTYNT
jgi:hypothetical protein